MENNLMMMVALTAMLGIGIGFAISRFLLNKALKARENAANSKAKAILKEAENEAEVLKKNKILEAKEKFLQLKSEHEKAIR